MLKSGNKSEKNVATEFENDFNHNKNNRLKCESVFNLF